MTALLHAEVDHARRVEPAGINGMAAEFAFPVLTSGNGADGSAAVLAAQGTGSVGSTEMVSIAVDARIDNRVHLAKSLGLDPDVTDTELLLAGYRRHEFGLFSRILGDGILVLWDDQRRRFIAWRDVAGTRPLYYSALPGGRLVVSSDLRSLAAHPAVRFELDLEYASALLRGGPEFHTQYRTLISSVHKLPAAHVLVGTADRIEVRPYWTPEDVPARENQDDSDYVDELRSLVEAAVECRLGNDPTVGAHLSGGLDSSSMATLAARLARTDGRRAIGISWAPPFSLLPQLEIDERPLAESVARNADIELRFTALDADDVVDVETRDLALRPSTTLHHELTASRGLVPTMGVRTVLTGWGGDEMVVNNGKGYFADLARRGRWRRLHRELRARSGIHGSSYASQIRGRVVLPLVPDVVVDRTRLTKRFDALTLQPQLKPDFRAALDRTTALSVEPLRERPGVRRYQIRKLRYGHLQYRMESWAAHGLDIGVRYEYPLLDRRLIEFALSIPDHLYFRDGWKRWLYRTAMAGILPDEVRWYPDKQDNAMIRNANTVAATVRDRRFEAMRERRDNPFLDVDAFIEAAQSDIGRRRSETLGRAALSNAAFLPFTKATLG